MESWYIDLGAVWLYCRILSDNIFSSLKQYKKFKKMNAITPQNVINLPYSEKERLHKSRNRVGHHIFLSRYFSDFKNLSADTKIEVIYGPGGEPDNPYGDVDSIDTLP